MKERLIILDAGHGIDTSGKRTPLFRYENSEYPICVTEWELNIAVLLDLVKMFELSGVEAEFTSNILTDKSLATRIVTVADIANKNAGKDVALLSIHHNAFGNCVDFNHASGAEFLYSPKNGENHNLAKSISDKFTGRFKANPIAYKNRGVKVRKDLYLLNNSIVPACLVEVGFMTNRVELTNLLNHEYRHFMSSNICNGVIAYFKSRK